jgi:hypothetical protein
MWPISPDHRVHLDLLELQVHQMVLLDPQGFLAHLDQLTDLQDPQERQVFRARLVVLDLLDLEGQGQLEYREYQDHPDQPGLMEYREDRELLELWDPQDQVVHLDLKETQEAQGLEVLVTCQGRQDLPE